MDENTKKQIIEMYELDYSIKEIAEKTSIAIGHYKIPDTIKNILYIKSRSYGGKISGKMFTKEQRQIWGKNSNNFFMKKKNDKEWHKKVGCLAGTTTQQKWRGSERQKEWCKKAGRASYESYKKNNHLCILNHPERSKWAKQNIEKYIKNNPKKCVERAKIMRQKTLENNPDFYKIIKENMKRWAQNNIKKQKINGQKGRESLRLNRRYIYKNIYFDSKQESKCCELLEQYGFEPIVGKTVHVSIGTKEIDFIFNNCCIEYHPYDYHKKTDDEYYNSRREIINNSEYKDYKLIIIKKLSEIKKLPELMM
jgi:hypothetical protein